MLCDDVVNDRRLPVAYPGFKRVREQLVSASKYVLAPDFAAAADGLMGNTSQLERIVPFCRLPAPACWFELAQADRPHYMTAPIHYSSFQSQPKRVGFLCVLEDPLKAWRWTTTLAWSLRVPPPSGPNNVSCVEIGVDTRDGFGGTSDLSRYTEVRVAPFCPPEALELLYLSTEFAKVLQSDWGGEIRYLISMMGLLCSRNVVEAEARRPAAARSRSGGRLPLLSHTVLKIRAAHRRSFGVRGTGTGDDVRRHFVVGHWKVRRTGLFWWNPHWRGAEELGTVTHDYEVGLQ